MPSIEGNSNSEGKSEERNSEDSNSEDSKLDDNKRKYSLYTISPWNRSGKEYYHKIRCLSTQELMKVNDENHSNL